MRISVFDGGAREEAPSLEALATTGDEIVWVELSNPSAATLAEVATRFDLPEHAVEDVVHAHQRPKLERYDTATFLVLRPARYIDETETVEFGELHIFAGPSFVVTVNHAPFPDVHRVCSGLDGEPTVLERGPLAIVHVLLDLVVDDYAPVSAGIENDIDEIQDELFGPSEADMSRRIYELTREVISFQRAVKPLVPMLEELMATAEVDETELRYIRDVHDHAVRLHDQADAYRDLLGDLLHVNLTLETRALSLLSHAQSEEVKKISAWAAILFAPTLVGTIYGMNFRHMPELQWQLGYPLALVMMVAIAVILYLAFRRKGWI